MKTLGWFLLRFGILFGLLAWPWPFLVPIIHAAFRAEVRLLADALLTPNSFRIETYSNPAHPTVDTMIVLTDRRNPNASDAASAAGISFDSASQGWIPLAMSAALILATPVPWLKRVQAILVATVVMQVLAASAILAGISVVPKGGAGPGLPFLMADHLLNDNLWFSFVPPFLFWTAWLAWGGHWEQLGGQIVQVSRRQGK